MRGGEFRKQEYILRTYRGEDMHYMRREKSTKCVYRWIVDRKYRTISHIIDSKYDTITAYVPRGMIGFVSEVKCREFECFPCPRNSVN